MERIAGMGKRVGRPKVAKGRKREVIFRFVATNAEAAKIREAAKDSGFLTISDYMRDRVIPK
jgi:hypothetical protein